MNRPYQELVTQAETAVSAIKDPELKRVAFEKVLDDLLSRNSDGGGPKETSRSRSISRQGTESKSSRSSGGPTACVEDMISEGFFAKQKAISEVKAELENRGHHIPLTSLSGPLKKLCQRKKLRRQRVDGEGKRKAFVYSKW